MQKKNRGISRNGNRYENIYSLLYKSQNAEVLCCAGTWSTDNLHEKFGFRTDNEITTTVSIKKILKNLKN